MKELIERYPRLSVCEGDIDEAIKALCDTFEGGGKLLLCGNGGSAADSEHIVGELMKGFLKYRPLGEDLRASMKERSPELEDVVLDKLERGLPAISLTSVNALNSAFANDVDAELIYAQSVLALGKEGDALIAISTSGNARNVCEAAKVARAIGIKVIGLTGKDGGKLKSLCDVAVVAPECETYKIQELHLPIYHYICSELERRFFPG